MVRLLVLLPLLGLVTVTMFTLRALWVGNVNMSFWKETWRALRMNHPVLGLLAPPSADEIDPFTGRNKRLRYLFVSLLVSISAALISFELAPDFVRAAAVCDELRALRETWDDQLHPPEGQCNAYCTASLHDMCRALGYKGSSLRFCLSTSGMTRQQCESSCPGVPADARNNCSPIPECKCEMHMYDEAAHKCFVFSPEKERWEPGRCRYSTRCAVNCRITSHSRKGCASAIAGTVLPRAGAEVTMCSQQRMVDMFGKFKDLFAVPQCDVPTRLPPQSLALMQARRDGAQAAAKVEAAQAAQTAPGRERGADGGAVDTRAVGSGGGGRFGRVNPTLPIHSGAGALIREQDAPSSPSSAPLAASLSLPGSIDHKLPGGIGGAVGVGGTAMLATPGHDVANNVAAAAAGDLAASGDAASGVVGQDISGTMSGGLLSEEDEGGGDDGGKFDEDDEDSIVDRRTEMDGAEDGIEDMNGAVRVGANGTHVAIVSTTGSRHVNGSSVNDMIGRGGSGSGGGVWHQEAPDSALPPRLRTSNRLVGLLADANQTSRIIGPAWTRGGIGGMEAPAGERNEGSFIRAVYSEEQQLRLGVNEDGEGAMNSTTATTATGTVLANHSNQTIQTNRSATTTLGPVELRDSNDDSVPSRESQDNGTHAYGTTQRLEPPRDNGTTFASLLQRSVAALMSSTTMSTATAATTATATATTGPANEAGVGGAGSTPSEGSIRRKEQNNSISNSSNSSNSSSNSSSSHNLIGLQGGGGGRRMLLGDTVEQQQQRSRREAPPLYQRTVEQQQQQQQQTRQQSRASPETRDKTGPYVRGSVAAREDGNNHPTDKTPLLEKRNKHRGRGRTSGNLVVASNLVGPKRRRHEDGKAFTSFSEHLHDHDSHAILDDLSHMDYASFWNASISLLPAGVGPHCGTLLKGGE